MAVLLTPKQLAELWNVSPAQLYPLIRAGLVPAVKVRNLWYIPDTILNSVKSLG